jgi:bifunctional non-homologous end joining protein LigD
VLQKHWDNRLPPFVQRVTIFSDAKGHVDDYAVCNNLATLVWLAQMGTLEFHAWHSRVCPGPDGTARSIDFSTSIEALRTSVIEYPDYILFDIDPFIYSGRETRSREPELNAPAFDRVRSVARALKALLDVTGLASFVKTSGKSGLHVIVPIRRTVPYAVVRELAHVVGQHLVREHAGDITMEWAVGRRAGKVFMDYNMNVRGKSIAAPYSPRGLPGAPVSMPLAWDELEHAYPTDFRITTAVTRLRERGDAWAHWMTRKEDIARRLGGQRR